MVSTQLLRLHAVALLSLPKHEWFLMPVSHQQRKKHVFMKGLNGFTDLSLNFFNCNNQAIQFV